MATERALNLVEPVTLASRLVRVPGVLYTEVADTPVVWEPTRRLLHELTPAAAALWGAFDGRPLRDVLDDLGGSEPVDERAVVEAVRRMRVMRIVEDADGDSAPAVDIETESGSRPDRVTVRGEVVAAEDGSGVVVVLAGEQAPSDDVEAEVVTLDVAALAVVDPDGSRPVRGFARVNASESSVTWSSPVELLGSLMAALVVGHDPEPLVLDALAALAEAQRAASSAT